MDDALLDNDGERREGGRPRGFVIFFFLGSSEGDWRAAPILVTESSCRRILVVVVVVAVVIVVHGDGNDTDRWLLLCCG